MQRSVHRRAAALLSAGLALALGDAAAKSDAPGLEFYGKLFPEWKVDRFGAPSEKGTEAGTLATLRNDASVLTRTPAPRAEFSDHEWSNSYLGLRGRQRHGAVTFGFNLQALIDLQGSALENFRARDAYAFVAHPAFGRLTAGQMDTIYKQYGDRVRMLGVSSGNFVGTSRILSGVSWRGQGEVTFHNRRGSTLAWQGPAWGGLEAGISHSFDAGSTVPGNDDTLTAAGLRWRRGDWYAAIATEIHRNWLPVSHGDRAAAPSSTSILNAPATARSRDQAWRLSAGWTPKGWRFGADLAQLRYTENDAVELAGKFRSYTNTTAQFSAERRLGDWRIGFNHARGTAGDCRLSGDIRCSTQGLGGHLTTLGAMHQINRELAVFLIGQHVHNAPGGRFSSAPNGATVRSVALGLKYEFQ